MTKRFLLTRIARIAFRLIRVICEIRVEQSN